MDIASLGIAMDTSGLARGEAALDTAAKTAGRTADAFDTVGAKATQAGKKVQQSAAQAANAMRMLPAQMTDIGVGLATGQSPLMVLLQQGGQLKDMFGGLVPAIQATASYVAGLVNPLTVTAGAVAALGYAYYAGNKEAKEFNATLQMTGNYAGLTASSLESMTRRVAADARTSFGEARDVLMDFAKTGRLTSSEMEGLATVVVRTAELTGEKLEDVSKDYAKVTADPAKWAAEHNQAMHFMDVATYQHIKALQDAGDKHAAVQAVIEAATAQVAASSAQHLSKAEQAWRSLSAGVQQFYAELKKGLSTGPTLQDQIDTLTGERRDIQGNRLAAGRVASIDKQVALLQEQQRMEQRAAESSAANARKQEDAIAAQLRVDKMRDEVMSNAQKRQKELEKLDKDRAAILAAGGSFSDADYARMVSGINEKYKDPKASGAGAAALENALGGQIAALEGYARQAKQIEHQSQLDLQQQRTMGLVSEREYIQKSYDLKENALQDQLAIAELEAEAASGRKSLAERERYASKVQEIEEQIVNVRKEGTNAVAAYDKRATDSLRAYTDALDNALKLRQQEIGQNIAGLGMGDTARDQLARIQQANRDFDQKFYDLSRSRREGRISEDDYQAQLAALQQYQTDRVLLEQSATQQMLAAQSSWELGATRALANYADAAQNVFAQTESLFTRAFGSMEDALVSFTMTGKLNFGDFAKSVISDLIRIQTRAALSGIFSQLGGSLLGMAGDATGISVGGVYGPATQAGLDSLVSSVSTRASGGDVQAGVPLLVGERGRPELFVPDSDGTIIPDNVLARKDAQQAAPMSVEINNTYHIDSRTDRSEIIAFIDQKSRQTKAEILDSMNRGGAFSPKR
ncbi:phage tail tape measure protein [Cupriavidus sp. a3]|uniref:phage tail tape measure protein n=1 Tax=Cupriavidus sp. a3 TaxID=3242158 RepID=UPI003D9C32E6